MQKQGHKEAVVARLAITKALRLQQIVTGFVKTDQDRVIKIVDNPRKSLLKELLEELAPKHKIIVWAVYKENYSLIASVCEELRIEYTTITGQDSSKEKYDNMDKFNEDENVRVLIANPASGGIGVNLVASDYSIYYSRSYKLGDALQSAARNHRKGSEIHEKITHINIIAEGTIDETIDKALEMKQNLADLILNKDNY
jgi:non-specific serine/threonine protein kinase